MCALTAGWLRCRTSDARVMLRSRATATNVLSWWMSMISPSGSGNLPAQGLERTHAPQHAGRDDPIQPPPFATAVGGHLTDTAAVLLRRPVAAPRSIYA